MQGLELDRSLSLADVAGSAFGDIQPSDEETPGSAEIPGDAAGAPPAEIPAAIADAAPIPEGTDPLIERAGAPPADAAVAAPDAGAPPILDVDPLASATPLTYTVNGESRTYDGIKVLGDDGAVVDAAALPDLIRRLGERDHLYETNQTQHQRVQALEKLSQWVATSPDGKEQVYEGERGLYEMRLGLVKLAVENEAMSALFQDPEKLVSMLVSGEDGKITFDPDKLEMLRLRMATSQREALDQTRSSLYQMVQPPPATPAAPDYATVGPAILQQAAATAKVDLAALSPKDKAFLIGQLPRYERPATEADRQGNPALKLGQPIVDHTFVEVVADRVALRAEQRAEQTKIAAVSTSAATQNAARLRAATPVPVAAPSAPDRSKEPAKSKSDERWDFEQSLISRKR